MITHCCETKKLSEVFYNHDSPNAELLHVMCHAKLFLTQCFEDKFSIQCKGYDI